LRSEPPDFALPDFALPGFDSAAVSSRPLGRQLRLSGGGMLWRWKGEKQLEAESGYSEGA